MNVTFIRIEIHDSSQTYSMALSAQSLKATYYVNMTIQYSHWEVTDRDTTNLDQDSMRQSTIITSQLQMITHIAKSKQRKCNGGIHVGQGQ